MQIEAVKIWEEKVTIPTYGVGKPDKNPMFFEKRIYQGSSGVVYPNPVIEKIFDEKEDKEYTGLFIENAFIKIMILPELGGRIQMAYDKIKERHFIYYNQVIKPALVGLTGPWISGGIEFNWPQHHRPSTFERVDYKLEENPDGSKTVWINEIEKMFKTKGMAGFTLHPDKAYIEIKAQLYNGTPLPQTFLWWANPAVKVNDDYQSVFPPDVNAVFDHGKRDVSSFPIATGTYYKVDYSPGTDISRYKNIPVPTSYMAINSSYDFMGGYEHDTHGGMLHVADHHVSPGKKQWTWGNSDFGIAWDRNLTDEDGPYIELMAGVFTDNQPDFSWIMPYEEKSFTQYFLPYRDLGIVKNATKDILLSLERTGGKIQVKIFATSEQSGAVVILKNTKTKLLDQVADLSPASVFTAEADVVEDSEDENYQLSVISSTGRELIRYDSAANLKNKMPVAAKAALLPASIENNEQLFLTARHLEQYRHATYSPVPYYEEALKRDEGDIRCNNGLGLWYMRRGQFETAETYFRQAIETSVSRNPNPYDGEPYYNLGLCLSYLEQYDEAYGFFYKSAWNSGLQDGAYFALARIDARNGDYTKALEHIDLSLDRNTRNAKAYVLKSAVLRKMGQSEAALFVCETGLRKDVFNLGLLFEKYLIAADNTALSSAVLEEITLNSNGAEETLLNFVLDYSAFGFNEEALKMLALIDPAQRSPMSDYHCAYLLNLNKDENGMTMSLRAAANSDSYLCFPNRLDDIKVLSFAADNNPSDAKAPYYLGNLFYDKLQYGQAITFWQISADRDDSFATVFRNLGIAAYNKQKDPEKALQYFNKANALDPSDGRVLMELDQLYKRTGSGPDDRLKFLEENIDIVQQRDDLYLERAALTNFTGQYAEAYNQVMQRVFHPWEGGEGRVSGQYLFSLTEMAKNDINSGNYPEAIEKLEQARSYPHNLGEGKLYGTQENDLDYWTGIAHEGLGNQREAKACFEKAACGDMLLVASVFYNDQNPEKLFYKGLALQKLGKKEQSDALFNEFVQYGSDHKNDEVRVDYFAVSLPDLLIFEDDFSIKNTIHCHYLEGLGYLGLQQPERAKAEFSKVLQMDKMHFGALRHGCLTVCPGS